MKTKQWVKRNDGVRQRYTFGVTPKISPTKTEPNNMAFGTIDLGQEEQNFGAAPELTVHKKAHHRKGFRKDVKAGHGVKMKKIAPTEVKGSEFKIKDLGAKGKGRKPAGLKIKTGMMPEGILDMPKMEAEKAVDAAIKKHGFKAVHSHLLLMKTLRAPKVKGTERKRTGKQLEDYHDAEALREYASKKFSKESKE